MIDHNFVVSCGIHVVQRREEDIECLRGYWVPHKGQQSRRVRREAFGIQDMSDSREVQETGSESTIPSCHLVFGGGGVSVRVHYVGFGGLGYVSIRGPRCIGVGVSIEGFAGKTYRSGYNEYRVG